MHKKDMTLGFACLDCRKIFKKHTYIQDKRGNREKVECDTVCPQCSKPMVATGSAFKAPINTGQIRVRLILRYIRVI